MINSLLKWSMTIEENTIRNRHHTCDNSLWLSLTWSQTVYLSKFSNSRREHIPWDLLSRPRLESKWHLNKTDWSSAFRWRFQFFFRRFAHQLWRNRIIFVFKRWDGQNWTFQRQNILRRSLLIKIYLQQPQFIYLMRMHKQR